MSRLAIGTTVGSVVSAFLGLSGRTAAGRGRSMPTSWVSLAAALVVATLVGCGPTAAPLPTPTAAVATPVANPTATPAAPSPTSPSASATPAARAAPTTADAGIRTFQIVPEQSEASYEVQEQFLGRPTPNKAIGRTKTIQGELQLGLEGKPTLGSNRFTVDLRTLASDEARRDQRIRTQWLESNKYPFAEFVATGIQDLPATVKDGQEVSFKLAGDLKVRDTTRPVTFDVQAKLQGDTLTGKATTLLYMKDFGFEPPDIAGMLRVADGVTVVVAFTAKATR